MQECGTIKYAFCYPKEAWLIKLITKTSQLRSPGSYLDEKLAVVELEVGHITLPR